MRLFVAVWPPADVVAALHAMPRPFTDVRWTTEDQWHVTLRFLGAVPEDDIPRLDADLADTAARCAGTDAVLGGAVRKLGTAIALTVDGLDDAAAAVIEVTRGYGEPPEHRRFLGHLTIARTRSRGDRVAPVARWPRVEAGWRASEIALVQSHLRQGVGGTARYETIGRYPLGQ